MVDGCHPINGELRITFYALRFSPRLPSIVAPSSGDRSLFISRQRVSAASDRAQAWEEGRHSGRFCGKREKSYNREMDLQTF